MVKDAVDLDCSSGCPPVGPTEALTLLSAFVQNDESELQARAIDGAGNVVYESKTVRKEIRLGITEPRLGRPLHIIDPDHPEIPEDEDDPNPYPIWDPIVFDPHEADPRFTALKPTYFRLFVPWERLEPEPDRIVWDADVGGACTKSDGRWYKSTIDKQIDRIRELNHDVEIVVTFTKTPCWAIFKYATPQGKDPCRPNDWGRLEDNNPASWPDLGRKVNGKSVLEHYREFVRAFAERYSDPNSPHYAGIKYYTAWNEPNHFSHAQPQYCKQKHEYRKTYPRFDEIPCPPDHDEGDLVSDNYYIRLYNELFDVINNRPNPNGMGPEVEFPGSVQVLGAEAADVFIRRQKYENSCWLPQVDTTAIWSRPRYSSDEGCFTAEVIEKILREESPRCGQAAWSKHAHKDLLDHSYIRVQ